MLRTILLATDGSNGSQRAANFAASLAIKYGAGIVVLNAYLPVSNNENLNHEQPSSQDTCAQAYLLVSAEANRLRELGVSTVEPQVMEGSAVHAILGTIDNCQCDLIVIGARGWSAWPGNFLGHISMAVTQRANCPVLVVR